MDEYLISFAGSTVSIHYDSSEVGQFLTLLFGDIPGSIPSSEYFTVLVFEEHAHTNDYSLTSGRDLLFRGSLGVNCAAVLFDAVIFHLLDKAEGGVALHAGAVIHRGGAILLPGQSGAGKSTLTAWLAVHGCAYLTDELIYLPEHDDDRIQFFSRPVCLKPASVSVVRNLIGKEKRAAILRDNHGAIVPHRVLNPDFSAVASRPVLILLPDWQADSSLHIEKVSAAKLCMALMSCHVNARNLENHGFNQVVRMSRSVPAYRIRYGAFKDLGDALDNLFDEVKRD